MSESQTSSENLPSLEERKFTYDCQAIDKEFYLKEREFSVKEAEIRKSRWLNPTVIGLFAAAIGLVGNLVVAFISNRSAQEIERNREQSNLIVQAVSTGNAEAACKNLISFIALGLLEDPKGTLGKCKTALDTIPVLPAAKTYTPTSDIQGSTSFNTTVVRTVKGNNYHYVITLSVPDRAGLDFNLVKIYAMQVDNNGVRAHDLNLPDVHGSWKSGDRVNLSADLPKSYAEDSAVKSYLRFCIGSEKECLPGPNLLLPQGQ